MSRIPDGNTASISPRSDRLFLKVDDHFPKWAMDGIWLDFDEPGLFSKKVGIDTAVSRNKCPFLKTGTVLFLS